jgi:GT2 family glycosyltransferase
MRIGTVIVTWNQTRLTLECLAALGAAGAAMGDVWVVDNGSAPPALPVVAARFPGVRSLDLGRNTGFTGGSNAGAAAALAAGCDAIFFLNNDALVAPGALDALGAALVSDGRIAAVAPKVCFADRPEIIQSAGMALDAESGIARSIGTGERDAGQHDAPADREALFGCALLVRREAWEQIGPFWEPFFSYAEEIDWCLRARRLGWRLRYTPATRVLHHASRSLAGDSPLRAYLIARNRELLRRRSASGGLAGLAGVVRGLAHDGRTALHYLRHGKPRHARALLLGRWDALRGATGDARSPDLRRR